MFVFPSPQDDGAAACDMHNLGDPGLSQWTEVKEYNLKKNFPLHCACRDGDASKLMNLLACISNTSPVEFGAVSPLSAQDPFYGWMPSHWAAYFGKLDCLCLVVQASRHADVPSLKLLQTPAHIAAFAGHTYCLQWLLNHGSDPSRWDYRRETPLHKAARSGSIDCISLLIGAGTKLQWTNIDGKTAAEVAEENGHHEAAQYLHLQMKFHQPCSTQGIHFNNSVSNGGYYGYHPSKTEQVEDVLLSTEASRNLAYIGGRKRSMEVADGEPVGKRSRNEALVPTYPPDVPMITNDKPMAGTKCRLAYYI